MGEPLKRYDLFGWDYEFHNPLTERQVAWYERFARMTGGPVLELACGAGRLLARLAEAGHEVVGMDLSEGMLALARRRAVQLPPAARGRITLHKGDMSRFELGRRFPLIIIADNSFRELSTRAQLLSCARCVCRHLPEGGKFLVTERRYDPALYTGGRRETGWSRPVRHPLTGEWVSRRAVAKVSERQKRIRGTMIYKTLRADGGEVLTECPFRAPLMLTEDYLALFRRAGFRASVFVGHEARPDDGKDPILCFVCEREA